MTVAEQDSHWMRHALMLADRAALQDEVPVGAIVVYEGRIIGEGYNTSITQCDPSAHAEVVALRAAALQVGNYRLLNTTLYVTLEPCFMCAGAMVHARVQRLVYGAYDPKSGVISSQANILASSFLNHQVATVGGVLAEECGERLSRFFRGKR